MNSTVYILRGASGSGKSTWAKTKSSGAYPEASFIVSADKYFMKDGVYKFDPTKLQEAHSSCLQEYISLLQKKENYFPFRIVVDNTNCTIAEISPYIALAKMVGAGVHVLEFPQCDENGNSVYGRGEHKVPLHSFIHQVAELQLSKKFWPSHWPPIQLLP
jgi:predicted kinase